MQRVADPDLLKPLGSSPRLGIDIPTATVGLVAFGVRMIWVLAFARVPSGDRLSDPLLYHGYALRFAAGRGYVSLVDLPTSYYPPGYPFFLGIVYRVIDALGIQQWRAEVVGGVQSLLWAIAAIAVVLTARWAFDSLRVGIAAGLVLALWPNLITYAGAWLSESLFVCLFSIGVAAATFVAGSTSGDRRWYRGIGVAAVMFALATMVRPQVLLGLPLLAVAWLWAGIGWRRTLALGLATTAAVAALVVPWTIRNNAVLGESVFVSTNGGDNLCVGYHPEARGGFAIPPYCDTGESRVDGVDAELRRNAETRQLALDYIRTEPLSLPWLGVRKLYWTFRTDDDGLRGNESYGDQSLSGVPQQGFEGSARDTGQVISGTARTVWVVITQGFYALVILASIAGIVTAIRSSFRRPRNAAVLSLLGFTLAGVAVPILFFGDPRFKVPTTPLFAVFAGLALIELLAWLGWTDRSASGDQVSGEHPPSVPDALNDQPT